MAWYDFFKLLHYAFSNPNPPEGAGVCTGGDTIPDIRGSSFWDGRTIRLRENEFIDLSRMGRYAQPAVDWKREGF